MQSADFFTQLGSIASAVTAIVAAVGLSYAGLQLRASRKIARGEFLLRLDEILWHHHNEVHKKLRPGGAWSGGGGPESNEDWVAVELYMGLFERIKVLMDDGIIDGKTFSRLYGYRLRNILRNRIIYQAKLVERKDHWTDFINLCRDLEIL